MRWKKGFDPEAEVGLLGWLGSGSQGSFVNRGGGQGQPPTPKPPLLASSRLWAGLFAKIVCKTTL